MCDGAVTIALHGRREDIERLVDEVDRFALRHGLGEDDTAALHLALDELVINIVKHGYRADTDRPIGITLTRTGHLLTTVIEDHAPAFDPTGVPAPDLEQPLDARPVGGLGLHIVRSLVDSMTYERHDDSNVLTLTKTLAPLATGESGR